MKPSDTIDVLICVHSQDYEHDMLLQRALESLTRQTYDEFRTVVVLDECHRDTRGIVENYAEVLDIRILERPRKQGLASAKNYGLKQCTANWVTYLDADDQWMDCKLEVQRKFLLNRPDIDFCFTECWDLENDVLRPNCFGVGQYQTHEQILAALPRENVLAHGSAMIRRVAIETLNGYRTDKFLLGREDYDLWQRAAASGFIFWKVPERVYVYSLGTSVPR